MSERVTFWDCVREAARQPGFVELFDRLTGHHLAQLAKRSPLDAMIDEATGRDREEVIAFLAFVWETVYTRLPADVTDIEARLAACRPGKETQA